MSFASYFAGFLCVEINASCSLVAAGGEDDCVSVWDIEGKTLVGRCEGHRAWVAGLAFDQNNTNILYSIGQDGMLLIWDLADRACTVALVETKHEQYGHPLMSIPVRLPMDNIEVSNVPLTCIDSKEDCIFVSDGKGLIVMWSSQPKNVLEP